MVTIKWCLQQKNGIELIEPSENLSKSYFREAKETLLQIHGTGSKWEVIMGYYACYHALYAVLQKAGVKSEIHDCTIELMPLIKAFIDKEYHFLKDLKRRRIDAQYYLKPEKLESSVPIKKFLLRCEEIAQDLDIEVLRGKINAQK